MKRQLHQPAAVNHSLVVPPLGLIRLLDQRKENVSFPWQIQSADCPGARRQIPRRFSAFTRCSFTRRAQRGVSEISHLSRRRLVSRDRWDRLLQLDGRGWPLNEQMFAAVGATGARLDIIPPPNRDRRDSSEGFSGQSHGPSVTFLSLFLP